jgi:hypothetical protein
LRNQFFCEPRLERLDPDLLTCRNAIRHDRLCQRAYDTRDQRRPSRASRRQIPLPTERRHVIEAGFFENHPKTRADHRPRAGSRECGADPSQRLFGQRDWRLGPCGADIVVNGDKQPTWAKTVDVVAHDAHRIGNVKQQQPSDDEIEREVVAPGRTSPYVNEMRSPPARRRASSTASAD